MRDNINDEKKKRTCKKEDNKRKKTKGDNLDDIIKKNC